MEPSTLIDSTKFVAIASALGGIIIAVITKSLLNKRGLFTYRVSHNRIGLSAEDTIYGSVKVTWNDKAVSDLYLSTVHITNQSMKDFDSVIVRIFTDNTMLLSQRTNIVGTTRWIDFSEEYKTRTVVAEGEQPSDAQLELYRHQREYHVPTMNRGQMLRFQFLNAGHSEEQPVILVDVLHKGVKCEFRITENQFLGVPWTQAVAAGTVVGLTAVGFVIIYVESVPLAALLSFVIGWLVLVPGAYTVKAWRKFRHWLAD